MAQCNFRLSPEEMRLLDDYASRAGLSRSEYLRKCALNPELAHWIEAYRRLVSAILAAVSEGRADG